MVTEFGVDENLFELKRAEGAIQVHDGDGHRTPAIS